MKTRIIKIIFLLSFFCSNTDGQKKEDRLPFIITVDNEFPSAEVTNGEFQIKNTEGVVKTTIKFHYYTGSILLLHSDFKKILTVDKRLRVFIKFKYITPLPYNEDIYEEQLPELFLNDHYNIMRIFTVKDEISNRTYFFKKDQKYVIQYICPDYSTVMTVLKK